MEIKIPVYIGGKKIDEIISEAQQKEDETEIIIPVYLDMSKIKGKGITIHASQSPK